MDDLISRLDAIEAVQIRIKQIGYENDPKVLSIRQAIRDVPSVNPVRHGKWISIGHKLSRICSVCYSDEPYKFADDDANVYDYCPHCGARMDG